MQKLALALIPFLALAALPAHAAEPTVCPMIYAPVCAAQQVECVKAPCYPVYHTYANDCLAGAEGAPVIHAGECTASESGPVKPQPPYTPPKGCIAWFDGCNICSIGPSGEKRCTMRACMVYNILPGKCTAYAKPIATSTPPLATTTDATVSSSVATSSSRSSSAISERVVHRILNWLRHLFGR